MSVSEELKISLIKTNA